MKVSGSVLNRPVAKPLFGTASVNQSRFPNLFHGPDGNFWCTFVVYPEGSAQRSLLSAEKRLSRLLEPITIHTFGDDGKCQPVNVPPAIDIGGSRRVIGIPVSPDGEPEFFRNPIILTPGEVATYNLFDLDVHKGADTAKHLIFKFLLGNQVSRTGHSEDEKSVLDAFQSHLQRSQCLNELSNITGTAETNAKKSLLKMGLEYLTALARKLFH